MVIGFIDVDGDIQGQMFGVPSGGNEIVPPGYQLVERTAIIRLGPQMHIHTAGGHGSLGITGISAVKDASTGNEYALRVYTDFDTSRELILDAKANPDYTLVKKRVSVGGSGGAEYCTFRIQSEVSQVHGSTTYAAGTGLPPHGTMFNSAVDNIWVRFKSLRELV